MIKQSKIKWLLLKATKNLVMKRKVFTGTHFENIYNAKKWAKSHNVIVLKGIDEPTGKLDFRLKKTSARKAHTLTIWYCWDNVFTRALGYSEMLDHFKYA